jgi:DNA-binding FadR family transcriptional regulator
MMTDTASLGIEPLPGGNVNETIQARLMQFIGDHGLRADDRLPSQAALTQALNVSMVALREAMRGLEALGIIEARVGSGWYVRDFSFDAVAKGLAYTFQINRHNFGDLLEIRIRMESSFLPEAMSALTPDDLDALEGYVAEMQRLADAGQDFDAPDRSFHMQLFAGKVRNQLFIEILSLFWTLYSRLPASSAAAPRDTLLEDAARHRLLLDALIAGDVELARERLLESLQGAIRRVMW